ncbi:MAG: ABC transporter ATP-binding protein [Bacteroidales bacterium]|nr:ABC transporter ATP-binding protein [Bacteroidales bacterium]
MEQNPVVEVKNVHKSFKSVHAVKGVNLSILPGHFIALLGPNGAGKTTLVEMIEGIQKPDRGEILLLGKKWSGNEEEIHRNIGISLQETRFVDKLTVGETLKLFASFYRLNNSRVTEIIELIELEEKRKAYVQNLSGGQRQRLALGIALLNKPRILLLDEPTTGLDPNARREVWAILKKLKEESKTSMILTTHYMEEAEQLCDYIIIIDKGRIIREGTLDQLLNHEINHKTIEFTLETTTATAELFIPCNFEIKYDDLSGKGSAYINNMETELPELLSYFRKKDLTLKNLECRKNTLDDLFTSLTGRHLNE